MIKKLLISTIVIVFLFGLFRFLSTNKNPTILGVSDSEAELILFWGNGCPHCETVKNYIKDNQIESKLKISYKEVYFNKENQKQLNETANKCPNIDKSQGIGVPFAYIPDSQQCLIGDQPIIDHISSRTK